QFVQVENTTRQTLSDLLADMAARRPVDDFDFPALSIADEEDQVVAFAQDIQRVVQLIARECGRRGKAADDLIVQHNAAATAAARVKLLGDAAKALFGDEFVVFPEFSLAAAQGDEVASSFGDTATLLDYVTNTVKIE